MIPRGHKLQIPPYNVTSESHENKGKDNLRSCWSLYKFSLWHLRKNIENCMKNMATDHSKLIGLWFGSSLIQNFTIFPLMYRLFPCSGSHCQRNQVACWVQLTSMSNFPLGFGCQEQLRDFFVAEHQLVISCFSSKEAFLR